MSDGTQIIVDREVETPEEARRLGTEIVAWLVAKGIIDATPGSCCLGGDGLGYPPGRNFMQAADGMENDALNGNHAAFSRMAVNGLRVVTERACFADAQGDFAPGRCPHCQGEVDVERMLDCGGVWIEGGEGELECDHCGAAIPVTACEHTDVAFATLGFEFWNWPPFSAAFLAAFERRLGHRTSLITGKL